LALGHGHLLVPFKGRAIPSREDFLDALEYTAFGSITKDIQAYFVQRNLGDNGGFVTAHPGGALAMIDILMAEGYSHDDWMPDLLNVFRNAFLDYPFSAVGAKPEPRQLESEFEGKVQFAPPVVFFVAEAGTLTTKSDGAARKEKRDVGDRPFVAALKALPHGSTDFDGAVVTAE
jgi:hypothetical protein